MNPQPTTTLTLHGITLRDPRELVPNLFIASNPELDEHKDPVNVKVYGKSFACVYRGTVPGTGGHFRGHASNWITKRGRVCFKVEVFADEMGREVRKLYKSRGGALRALERLAIQVVGPSAA